MPINRHGVELGVFVGVANLLIFQHNLPPAVDVRSVPAYNQDVESAERLALMESTALTLLVAGFARSLDTFIVAGAIVVAVDFAFKYLNAVNPDTGKIHGAQSNSANGQHPLPDYQMAG